MTGIQPMVTNSVSRNFGEENVGKPQRQPELRNRKLTIGSLPIQTSVSSFVMRNQ